MEYSFRADCKGCEDRLDCNLDKSQKSYNEKCYIHSIARRINKKPIDIFRARKHFFDVLWIMPEEWCNDDTFKNEMIGLSETEKKVFISNLSFHGKSLYNESDEFIKIVVAIYNTIFDIWRTDNIVHCIRCGKLMENNKRHNRRYCDDCKGYQKSISINRKCTDCGCIFNVEPNNKRQFRCDICQRKADKENARNRKRRQREKVKCHVFC